MSFVSIFPEKYQKQLLDRGIDSLKTTSIYVIQKAGEFLENKIVEAVTNSYNNKIVKPVEEIIILPEKREDILNELRQVL